MAFDYGDPASSVNDISFYVPPDSTKPYPMVSPSRETTNVIFMIGDGMGVAQVMLTRLRATGRAGRLHMERMPCVGLVNTCSANALVTDSAAAGTALACGTKTHNGMLGMKPNGDRFISILEAAAKKGRRTGLVATSAIAHATPAAFSSHVEARKMGAAIAEQQLANRVNVMLAGGKAEWIPQSQEESRREDDRNLLAEAQQAGYLFVDTKEKMFAAMGDYVLGLFQINALTTQEPEPTLAEMTQKAIQLLDEGCHRSDADKGFFLMVEGSQIDWACHANDPHKCVRQTLLFDQAVKAALDFAMKDMNTLVIVTADHETGGLTINGANFRKKRINIVWTSKGHTALPVPLYAFGPGSTELCGVYDNTQIAKRIAKRWAINPFPRKLK